MTSSGCGCSVLVLLAVGPVLPGQTDPPTAALLFLGVSLKATRKKKKKFEFEVSPNLQHKINNPTIFFDPETLDLDLAVALTPQYEQMNLL